MLRSSLGSSPRSSGFNGGASPAVSRREHRAGGVAVGAPDGAVALPTSRTDCRWTWSRSPRATSGTRQPARPDLILYASPHPGMLEAKPGWLRFCWPGTVGLTALKSAENSARGQRGRVNAGPPRPAARRQISHIAPRFGPERVGGMAPLPLAGGTPVLHNQSVCRPAFSQAALSACARRARHHRRRAAVEQPRQGTGHAAGRRAGRDRDQRRGGLQDHAA